MFLRILETPPFLSIALIALSIDKRSLGAIFLANSSKLSPTVTPFLIEYSNSLVLQSASTFLQTVSFGMSSI